MVNDSCKQNIVVFRGFEPRSGHPSRPQPGEPCGVEDKPKDWVLLKVKVDFVQFWSSIFVGNIEVLE